MSQDQHYSAEENRSRQAQDQDRGERFARWSELIAVCLLFIGLVVALLFPDFRKSVADNPLILGWYSAFVVIDAVGAAYCFRRIKNFIRR